MFLSRVKASFGDTFVSFSESSNEKSNLTGLSGSSVENSLSFLQISWKTLNYNNYIEKLKQCISPLYQIAENQGFQFIDKI